MSYFDVELNILDRLSVDGGVGSLNRLWLDKIVLNGDTTDMVTAVITRFNGSVSYLTGTFNSDDLSTLYAVAYHNPRVPTDTEFVYLTVQTPDEIQSDGLDDALIFRHFEFPDDLPINYQPQLDELDNRLDEAEITIADHENRITESEGIIVEHTTKISTLENTVGGHSNQIREIIHELEGTINDVHGLENRVNSAENTLENHTTQINSNTTKINEN